jgi:hypothetical protein
MYGIGNEFHPSDSGTQPGVVTPLRRPVEGTSARLLSMYRDRAAPASEPTLSGRPLYPVVHTLEAPLKDPDARER